MYKHSENEMSDAKAIAQTDYPLTAQSLAEQLHTCGLRPGQPVVVHMAMSRLEWVIGGAEAVIRCAGYIRHPSFRKAWDNGMQVLPLTRRNRVTCSYQAAYAGG